ncbi:MAG: alpha-amylase family glycosyl hydrolase [Bacteroidales bacterium]
MKIEKIIIVCLLLTGLISGCSSPQKKDPSEKMKGIEKTAFEDPPQWAAEVVWYQIFVERFRNGDSSNDPQKEDIVGAYPGFVPDAWEVTPWTWDWYREDPYMEGIEDLEDLNGNKMEYFGQKAQLRRYGGDLQGVLDKIDYLDSLGIGAVYFNPLNDAPSLHKYDARNWRHVDVNFGPDPEGDKKIIADEDPADPSTWKFTKADQMFIEVIRAFHDRDIKVILDYSWNHTGITFWAWQDVLKNQQSSQFADWYWINSFDDPQTDENEFDYRGWLGVASLPEIKETEYHDHSKRVTTFEGDVYDDKVKEHIFAITRRWLDPNGDGDPSDGVDGYRLDVAAEMPLGFWREYREVVREVNPNAFLLGEIWWEEFPDKLLNPKEFLEGDIFDAPMNYRWYRAARHFFNESPDEIMVSAFVDSLNSFRSDLREVSNYAMMNLVASHDVPRVLTSLFNKNKYKYNATTSADPDYKIHKPDEATFETLEMLLAHQFTYIGAPHIWAGDEMGMWGADDPSTRKPLTWYDMVFDPEKTHPLGQKRPVDSVEFNSELFNYFRKLITIRNTHDVLHHGNIEFLTADDNEKILSYSRFNNTEEVIAVFNASDQVREITLKPKFNNRYTDLLKNSRVLIVEDSLQVVLPPRKSAILSPDS